MNNYSVLWFDTFLSAVPAEQTAREIDFLARNLLQPAYQTVLDVCCGTGRHTRELSALGYRVTGLDASAYALDIARRTDPETTYVQGDIRELETALRDAPQKSFDAVLSLWQSFGYFDDATNENLLRQIALCLNPRGCLILDLYNSDFYKTRQGGHLVERAGRTFWETKELRGNRLRVELDFGDAREIFDWQIFTPDEIAALAARCGLDEMLRCANFDENVLPNADAPRMQFILQRTDA
jgi:SAM-dependent methyltransferase